MMSSTQNSIDIAGIKDGVVILKNGGYRIILTVTATNFALKSEQEQNSLIFQYQSFLNSLHFPIQILIRSKRLDLTPYLKKINELIEKQDNELLKIQTIDYADFVTKLIDLANIMKKNFYAVVSFNPVTAQKTGLVDKIFNREKSVIAEMRISEDEFKKNSGQIRQHAQVVASGLASMGLRCTQLNTEEVIELLYQIYNPEIAAKERFKNAEDLTAPVIEHTSEQAEGKKPAGEQQEQVVDNSAAVQSFEKEKAMQKKQEEAKEGERQIGMTPAGAKAPEPPKNETPSQPPDNTQTPKTSDEPKEAAV